MPNSARGASCAVMNKICGPYTEGDRALSGSQLTLKLLLWQVGT